MKFTVRVGYKSNHSRRGWWSGFWMARNFRFSSPVEFYSSKEHNKIPQAETTRVHTMCAYVHVCSCACWVLVCVQNHPFMQNMSDSNTEIIALFVRDHQEYGGAAMAQRYLLQQQPGAPATTATNGNGRCCCCGCCGTLRWSSTYVLTTANDESKAPQRLS